MDGETGTGTAYESNLHFIRTVFLEKQNEEMCQGTKIYAKLQLSSKIYTKEQRVKCGLV